MIKKKMNFKKKPVFKKSKNRFRIKKCWLTKAKVNYIDYRDVNLLGKFLFLKRILSNKKTGIKSKYQREIVKAIKRARYMSLIPY